MNTENYFEITVKSDEQKAIHIISSLLILSAVSSLMYFAFSYFFTEQLRNAAIFLFVVCAIILIIWFVILFSKRYIPYRYAFFLCGLAFMFYYPQPTAKYFLGGLYIILGFIENIVRKPKTITVNDSGILFSGLPGKYFAWEKIGNMLIKDGLITIDFKNNKLYQKEIEGYTTKEIEQEFNAFTSSKIYTSTTQ